MNSIGTDRVKTKSMLVCYSNPIYYGYIGYVGVNDKLCANKLSNFTGNVWQGKYCI